MNLPNTTVVPGEGELSALLAAILLSPLLPIIHVALLRVFRKANGSLILLAAFACYAGLWFLIIALLRNTMRQSAAELIIGGSLTLAALLAYMEFFSVVCRSFSLRILVDIRERGALSLDDIYRSYAGGRGIEWLMEKRIGGLVSLGLVRRSGDVLEISPAGRMAGQLGLAAKRILDIGKGG